MSSLNDKVLNAAKWSTITEVIAKLITPITNMILARILIPEAFGVISTVTMIISFADMFTDSGFQKYLIQHEFDSEEEKNLSTNVAFWTNLTISIMMWGGIMIFSEQIASMLGNPGLGNVITISCVQLPMTSFSSIQMALYRREFDFKGLFTVRLISILIPCFITIPLAILGYSYWSLVIGNIVGQLFNAIILTKNSKWKPSLIYSFYNLKKMISFSIWSLIEAISIWFTTWLDAFIIGYYLNQHYLGLYKTSISMVNSIMAIVTASMMPVLFSALSRLEKNEKEFQAMFNKLQRCVAYLVFPMGVGIFIYRDLATKLFLGDQWIEAADIIGVWSLTSVIVIIYSNFNSEVYRAKGKPKISFLSQIIHLLFLVPTCIISLNYGFWAFVYSRSLIRLQGVVVGLFIMKIIMGFSIRGIFHNSFKPIMCTGIMGITALILKQISNSVEWSILSIVICSILYFIVFFILGQDDFQTIQGTITNKNKASK